MNDTNQDPVFLVIQELYPEIFYPLKPESPISCFFRDPYPPNQNLSQIGLVYSDGTRALLLGEKYTRKFRKRLIKLKILNRKKKIDYICKNHKSWV